VPFKVCLLKGESSNLGQVESFPHTDKVIGYSVGVTTDKESGFILFNWFRSMTKEENVLLVIYIF
jgi:hypothetical protein